MRAPAGRPKTYRASFVHASADVHVQRDDFDVSLCNSTAKRRRRKGLRPWNESDCCSLLPLTDRHFRDACQAPAQRDFHGRGARWSRDAPHLRDDAAKAVARIWRHGLRPARHVDARRHCYQ